MPETYDQTCWQHVSKLAERIGASNVSLTMVPAPDKGEGVQLLTYSMEINGDRYADAIYALPGMIESSGKGLALAMHQQILAIVVNGLSLVKQPNA